MKKISEYYTQKSKNSCPQFLYSSDVIHFLNMAWFSRKSYGELSRKYDSHASRIKYETAKLDRDAHRGKVFTNSYVNQRTQLDLNYKKLLSFATRLRTLYDPNGKPKEKKKIEKKLAYVNDSLKEINSAYRQLDEDQTSALKKYAKAHGKISREEGKIISQLEEREKKMLKHGQSLEEKIEKIVPVFLLTAASASFGYSLLNTLSRDISNITGSIIGINPSNGPSLLLSTLALIIIIFIVSPSGSFKELLKKK